MKKDNCEELERISAGIEINLRDLTIITAGVIYAHMNIDDFKEEAGICDECIERVLPLITELRDGLQEGLKVLDGKSSSKIPIISKKMTRKEFIKFMKNLEDV